MNTQNINSVARYSFPILGANVLQSLLSSISAVWIAKLVGEYALAAAASVGILLFVGLSGLFGVVQAGCIALGHAVGRADLAAAKRIAGTVLGGVVLMSVPACLATWLFAGDVLERLLNVPEGVLGPATVYLRCVMVLMPLQLGCQIVAMLVRAHGDPGFQLHVMLGSVLAVCILAPLLIAGAGPLPPLGIAGGALSVPFAQIMATAVVLARLYRRRHPLCIRRDELSLLRPDRKLLLSYVRSGTPMGVQMIVIALAPYVMMVLVNGLGPVPAVAFSAVIQIWVYVQMPSVAVATAITVICAQLLGARRHVELQARVAAGLVLDLALTGSLVAATYWFGHVLLKLLLPVQSDAWAEAVRINEIGLWSVLLLGPVYITQGALRAAGHVYLPLAILMLTLVLGRLAFAEVTIRAGHPQAIWWSLPLGAAAALMLTVILIGWRGLGVPSLAKSA